MKSCFSQAVVLFLTIGLAVAVGGVMSIYEGWVLSRMWAWFAYPLTGVRVSVVQAVGISYMMALLTNQYVPGDRKISEIIVFNLSLATTCLVMGYLFHTYG